MKYLAVFEELNSIKAEPITLLFFRMILIFTILLSIVKIKKLYT